jgi:hypothetical protein
VALSLTLTERISGVQLTAVDVPSAPLLVSIAGQNKIGVTWSAGSGGAPSERVELRVEGNASPKQFQKLTIEWGDGSPDDVAIGLGKSIQEFFLHTYTGAGPFTITATGLVYSGGATQVGALVITPDLSSDYAVDQAQLEKYEDEVLRYAPDWTPVDLLATAFTDGQVARGFRYKYRIRFRTLDRKSAATVTSQFSSLAIQNPWT